MGDNLGTKTLTSTDDYVSILKLQLYSQTKKVLIHLKEGNVNAVKYKILASNDDITYETLLAETVLAKNGSDYQVVDDPWNFIDIQFKASVGASQGSLKVCVSGG